MQYIADTKEFHIAEPTVVSIGKFDGLHCGHKKLVAEMMNYRVQGRKAAMFTFSQPPGTLVKGKTQNVIMTNREREQLLEEAGLDYLVEYPFDEEVRTMPPEKFVSDILVEMPEGNVCALIVPCPGKFCGLAGRQEDYLIPWNTVRKIGPDIVLVETKPGDCRVPRSGKGFLF